MNADSMKYKIREMSRNMGIDAQEIWQMFFLERILERVSHSIYKENFIIKGGFLIASLIGINSRSTRDVDATIKSYRVNEYEIENMIDEVFSVDVDDGIRFKIQFVKEIRQDAEYSGYRVVAVAELAGMRQPVKIDITTGDQITPAEIEYEYESSFGFENINVMSYNIETILAEKLESILVRGEENTRMRDYYDIHMLLRRYERSINGRHLERALQATAKYRGSMEAVELNQEIMEVIEASEVLGHLWQEYQRKYTYARDIYYDEVVKSVKSLIQMAI